MALFVYTETLSHDHIALTSAHLQLYELRAKAFIAGRLHLLPAAHRVSSPKGQLQDVWGKFRRAGMVEPAVALGDSQESRHVLVWDLGSVREL